MALGADELMNRFGPCMGIIEHRINNLKSLNRVKGRLDLLLNQMEDHPSLDIIEATNENLLVYQDESEEDMNQGESSEEDGDSDQDENMVTDDDDEEEDMAEEEDESRPTDGEEEEDDDDDDDDVELDSD